MRLNQCIAQATGMSRRNADKAIQDGRVAINGKLATLGQQIDDSDEVALDGRTITPAVKTITVMLNKPIGFVCSRDGQGSRTIYNLLPETLHQLKPVGRLDKDSSGLLLLTNDGQLAHQLTHPSFEKTKVYEVSLDKALADEDKDRVKHGVQLEDGPSLLQLNGGGNNWTITMHEGRNRQIRRTFETLGYRVVKLHRIQFGGYVLGSLKTGNYQAA